MLAPVVVAVAVVPFRDTLPSTVAVLILVTVVVAVAASGHRAAGWLASVSAAVWFDYFLTRPYEHFAIAHRADIETTLLLLVVGTAVTELAVRGRRHRQVAETDAAYLDAIRTTTDLVVSGALPQRVAHVVRDQLMQLLNPVECRFERGRFGGLPVLGPDGRIHAGPATATVRVIGAASVRPVELRAGNYGRFVLTLDTLAPYDVLAGQVAAILSNQVGAAHSRTASTSTHETRRILG